MALNLELKIKTPSHSSIIKKMRRPDYKFIGELKQKDVYYKVKKGLLKLRIENGEFTLIKYLRDEKGKRWSNYYLLKLIGDNPEEYLGTILRIDTVVEKKRKLYMFKNTRIHLDTVKSLGNFLELESVVTGNRKTSEKEFYQVVNDLNLDLSGQIRASYKKLLGRIK